MFLSREDPFRPIANNIYIVRYELLQITSDLILNSDTRVYLVYYACMRGVYDVSYQIGKTIFDAI